MENITIKINGREVSAPQGSTILEAARLAQIEIPTLCYLKEINVCGGSKRGSQSGDSLCISNQRRNGSLDKYTEGYCVQKKDITASFIQSRS